MDTRFRDFEVGLFDCCASPGGFGRCCFVFCCTPCAYGDQAARLPPGSGTFAAQRTTACAVHCCAMGFSIGGGAATAGLGAIATHLPLSALDYSGRRAVRRALGLSDADALGDALVAYFCMSCALCQQLNEVDRSASRATRRRTTLAPVDSFEERYTAVMAPALRAAASVGVTRTAPPPAQRMAAARPLSPAPSGRARPLSPGPSGRARPLSPGPNGRRALSPEGSARRRVASPSAKGSRR